MINSLTATEGLRAVRLGADSWMLYGQSKEIAALQNELAALRAALAALHIPPDNSAALAALQQSFLATQSSNNQQIEELQASTVGHGIALVDFGVFPGKTEVRAIVTAPGLLATNTVYAWPAMTATADHTVTDCYLEEMSCQVEGTTANSFVVTMRPRVGLAFGHFQINYLYL